MSNTNKLVLSLSAFMFVSCSSNGGGSSSVNSANTTQTPPQNTYQEQSLSINGTVADGYLVGAKVCLDANLNLACDHDEIYATTNDKGYYSFSAMQGMGMLPIVVEVSESVIDLDTNQAVGKKYTLSGQSGGGFISPITTLASNELLLNPSKSLEEIESDIKAILGLNSSIFSDYISNTSGDYVRVHEIAKMVAINLQNGTDAIQTNAASQGTTLDGTTKKALEIAMRSQIANSLAQIKNAVDTNTSYSVAFDFANIAQIANDMNVKLASVLATEQQNSLIFMYNEEKMARDVYNAMYAKWGDKIFANIAKSEQTHMDAVASLMQTYKIIVPSTEAGVYSVPEIQSLYASLIAQGDISNTEALKVGKLIEETDIKDLNERLIGATPAMITVYNKLKAGSYNHLNAFNSKL